MNFVHKETLSENDWEMIRSGKGFVLTDEEAEEMALNILGQTGYIRKRSDEEAEQMALDILDEAGYDLDTLKKKRTISNCPICKNKALVTVEHNFAHYGDSAEAEVFYIQCTNMGECGLRSPDFWTEREAIEGWNKACEKIKVQS